MIWISDGDSFKDYKYKATTTDSFVLLKVWQLSKRAACKQRLNYLTEKLCIWITHKQTFKDLNTTINTARRVILHEKIHWKRRRLTGESRDIFRSCTLSLFVYGLKCVLLSSTMSLYLSCHLQNSYLNQSARVVVIVIKRHVVKQLLNVSNWT